MMEYSIKRSEYGCIETLVINGQTFTKRSRRTDLGCRDMDEELSQQVEDAGFDDEVVEFVYDQFDNSFLALEFIEASEVIEEGEES